MRWGKTCSEMRSDVRHVARWNVMRCVAIRNMMCGTVSFDLLGWKGWVLRQGEVRWQGWV